MMTFEQVQNLLNNMGLIATIARNGKDIATVKAVVINGQIITQYPIEIGEIFSTLYRHVQLTAEYRYL